MCALLYLISGSKHTGDIKAGERKTHIFCWGDMLGKQSLQGILWGDGEGGGGRDFGIEMNILSISRYAYREAENCVYLLKFHLPSRSLSTSSRQKIQIHRMSHP